MVLVATLASGWHFLIDILGGTLISLLSILITNFLIRLPKGVLKRTEKSD